MWLFQAGQWADASEAQASADTLLCQLWGCTSGLACCSLYRLVSMSMTMRALSATQAALTPGEVHTAIDRALAAARSMLL